MPRIAIVILNWNGRHYLEKFLPGVVSHTPAKTGKVVVADNASTDGSTEFVKNNFPGVEIIEFDQNYGFALGYQKTLRMIDTDYYVLLNSDVEVTKNWVEPVVEFMDNNPGVGACMPKIKAFNNKEMFEYAGASGGFIDKYGFPFCRGRILNTIENDNGQYNACIKTFWASGACMFLRAKAYFQAGELDGDFFAHMEEIDLCWRLKNYGFSIYSFPRSTVFHVGGGTLPNNNPRKLYLNYRNNLFLLYKNLPSRNMFPLLCTRLIMDWLSALIYLLKFQPSFCWSVTRAHLSFFRQIRILHRKRKSLRHMNNIEPVSEIYSGSIVFDYMIKRIRKFSELKF